MNDNVKALTMFSAMLDAKEQMTQNDRQLVHVFVGSLSFEAATLIANAILQRFSDAGTCELTD